MFSLGKHALPLCLLCGPFSVIRFRILPAVPVFPALLLRQDAVLQRILINENAPEELRAILGYAGEDLERFVSEVDRRNKMRDTDRDSGFLFPIQKPSFFGRASLTGGMPSSGLCVNNDICTDGHYNVVGSTKQPIPGLYAIGNTCGQRFGIQYSTPCR